MASLCLIKRYFNKFKAILIIALLIPIWCLITYIFCNEHLLCKNGILDLTIKAFAFENKPKNKWRCRNYFDHFFFVCWFLYVQVATLLYKEILIHFLAHCSISLSLKTFVFSRFFDICGNLGNAKEFLEILLSSRPLTEEIRLF